jgi:hypothetical protein
MKHKHAKNMLAYAQDAMETDKPWERWEYLATECNQKWQQCEMHPSWITRNEYRRKPRTININGFEVPEPVREPLGIDVHYYIPYLGGPSLAVDTVWWNDDCDTNRLKSGIVHLTKEAAMIHAKALLSFTQK